MDYSVDDQIAGVVVITERIARFRHRPRMTNAPPVHLSGTSLARACGWHE